MPSVTLETEVQYLKGVGPRNGQALAKLGVKTVRDLLWHIPRRYEDRRNLPPLRSLQPGRPATVRGRLVAFEGRPARRGMVIVRATLYDGTGQVDLVWFNQPWIRRKLESYRGEVVAYGMVKANGYKYEITAPEWEIVEEDGDPIDFGRIVPIYPLSEGVYQKTVRGAVRTALASLPEIPDHLPDAMRRAHRLPAAADALRMVHAPADDEERTVGRRRLAFDEFLGLQLSLQMKRLEAALEEGIPFPIDELVAGRAPGSATPGDGLFAREDLVQQGVPLWDQIHQMLPFDLTGAQRKVIGEIFEDMKRPAPMNRLVQGDVGSGKTAVAACAMLAAVRSGYQVAMMAPTEILAEQHYANLHLLLEPVGIQVALLVGKLSAQQKRKAAEAVSAGRANVAVGTHALIQEGVAFDRLGLAIVDEQHRFGVLQRAALRQKGINPDVLVMTATPIPRTLTMAIYGDLDLSVIDELPPGRKPVKTHWRGPDERDKVYAGVRKLVEEGRQAYFVCPMISESEKMQAQAAVDLHYRLSKQVFPDLRVGLLHGQMKAPEKEEVMRAFRAHELDILVSTVVIEVGVDVPNASVMVVEDATRFGLSQLHQLRGRVGRGAAQSYCVLIADARSEEAQQRLEILVRTTDGFVIAEEDLRIRGPGEVAGTRQHGNLDFEVADLIQDSAILEEARSAAREVLERDAKLARPEHAGLRRLASGRRGEVALVTVS